NQTNPSAGFQDKFDAKKAREEVDQQYVLFPMWSSGSINPQNNNEDAAFDRKEHDSDVKKPEYEVNVSLSSSAQSGKQDDKTKKKAKGKSHVESSTGYRHLNANLKIALRTAEPKRVHQALKDPSWIEAMQEELLQFKMQKVWVLVDFLHGKMAIGFEYPDYPDKVYKVVKALYDLHQAPRAWYETLANYLLENGFQRGKIDQTLFIKKQKGDILLVQIYVDDIIFGATNKDLFKSFEKLMKDKFQMSSIGELTFFLGLQDPDGEDVDVHIYRSMLGSLMYLTSSRPDIMFTEVNDVTRLQALVDKKKVMVTEAAIKEILWLDDAEGVDCLPNEEIFAELARMGYEKPSTKLTFYKAFFSSQWKFLIHTILQTMSAKCTSWNEFGSAMASVVICLSTEPSIPSLTLPLQPPQDLPSTSQVQHTPPQSPQAQPQTQPQPQQIADFPMSLHQEALDTYAALTRRVEHLKYDKVDQALEIKKLKRRVKKLKKGNMVRVLKLRRLKRVGTLQRVDTSEDTVMDDASNQGRIIDEMDKDDDVALMDDKEEDKKDEEAKEDEPAEVQEVVDVVSTAKLIIEVVTAASETVTAASKIISTAEPQDPEEESTTSSIIPADTKSKDKGKEIMVEEPKPLKKKEQIEMDKEYARKLHAKLNKDIEWDLAIDHVKLKAKEDPAMEEEDSRALYSINETPTQKATKRRKLNEEVEDLKRNLEIMPDEDDEVYIEATALARKVPVVDYEIINLNNKPYYKII
nr:hypothetical protein [Tanacetum cinerariifolium]